MGQMTRLDNKSNGKLATPNANPSVARGPRLTRLTLWYDRGHDIRHEDSVSRNLARLHHLTYL
jgi:hypothetical protein